MSSIQTYQQLTAPPSIALALMSWKRAVVLSKQGGASPPMRFCPCEACAMHFEMLDRISVASLWERQ